MKMNLRRAWKPLFIAALIAVGVMVVFADFLRIQYVLNGPQPLPQRMGGAAIDWPSNTFVLSAPEIQIEQDGSLRVIAVMGFPVRGSDSDGVGVRSGLECVAYVGNNVPIPGGNEAVVVAETLQHDHDRRLWTFRFASGAVHDGWTIAFRWPYTGSPGFRGCDFAYARGKLVPHDDIPFITELTPTQERPCVLREIGSGEDRSVNLVAKLARKSAFARFRLNTLDAYAAGAPFPDTWSLTGNSDADSIKARDPSDPNLDYWRSVHGWLWYGEVPEEFFRQINMTGYVVRAEFDGLVEDYFIDDRFVVKLDGPETSRERIAEARTRGE